MSADHTNGDGQQTDDGDGFDIGGRQVLDEEGTVDSAVKQRLINARERVDEAEQALFINAETDPQLRLGRDEQTLVWGTAVKQFLRAIEPLLTSDDITAAEHYYTEYDIGEMRLIPPETQGYQFDYAAMAEEPDKHVRRAMGLPRNAELPKPTVRRFVGLQSIIEAPKVVDASWRVCVDASGPPPEHEYVRPQAREPVAKHIYEDSVRAADQFLQQAGVGLELGTPEVDDKETDAF